ncbi:MAG: hypothetical protein LBG88_03000 [Christensenellaceae bacterium]|jgi:hypothetical protein|nr:hypothetical protein [Christensenellaceae bacterium]
MRLKLKLPKISLPKLKLPKLGRKFFLGKKFLVCAGLAVIVAVGSVIILNGIQKDNLYNTALKNVAEARYYMKSAKGGNTTVQFVVGKRENPYKQDGVTSAPTAFALVNVTGDDTLKALSQIEGTINIGQDQFPVTLLQNPYNPLNFSCDIVSQINREVSPSEDVELTLFITDSKTSTYFKLENAFGEDAISWDKALQVATAKVGDKLKGQAFESYITIMDNVAQDSGAFWYVQFITGEGKTHYCVVAPDGSAIS